MSTIYKKNSTWYLSVSIGKNRLTRSLRTDDYKVAKALKPHIESQLIAEVTDFNKSNKQLDFPELAECFLKGEHGWAKNTYDLYKLVLRKYLNGEPLPALHGFPLRLITPGWPGSVSPKWLNKIWVRARIHDGMKMDRYRVPKYPVKPGTSVPL